MYPWVALFILLSSIVWGGCHKNKTELSSHDLASLDSAFSIVTYDVNALVSDSGFTQYRLIAQEWYIYDRVEKPYWRFPKGLLVEHFKDDSVVLSHIRADSAVYNQTDQIWDLWGNVRVINQRGDRFYAPSLRWNRLDAGFSCQDTILIITPERTLHGQNFKANDNFTRYSFEKNQGSALVKDDEEEDDGFSTEAIKKSASSLS